MTDRLFLNRDALYCLSICITSLSVWWNAYPKWPWIAANAKAVFGGAFAVLAFVIIPNAAAQDMSREEAKSEAAALAAGLDASVKNGAAQSVDGSTVPGFVTANPGATSHYANPHGLSSAGAAAMLGHEASNFVTGSMAARSLIGSAELNSWTAHGLAVEGDATTLVTEYGGAYGDCMSVCL